MAVQMSDHWAGQLGALRVHPVAQWVRAWTGDTLVVDSRSALLVWEPRRVVPEYAVPVADLLGELVPTTAGTGTESPVRMGEGGPPVLDPSTPFEVHSAPGTAWTIRTAAGDLENAAFSPDDPDLADHVVIAWRAFSRWCEEEQEVLGHPHDPFKRIDCLAGSRHVRISLDGEVLADSHRPTLLLETLLPVRYYLPPEDVRMDLLEATDHRSLCAYKGVASYWSARVGDRTVRDLAWTYPDPLHDALPVRDLVAFFTERVDLEVDGAVVPRPVSPWS